MVLAWTRRCALGGSLLVIACSTASSPALPANVDGGGNSGKSAIAFSIDPGLACAGGGGVCSAPSQAVTVGILADQDQTITLSLEGDYGDAALTSALVPVVGGHGQVTLETSSSPSTFTLVAREGGAASPPAASLSITVGESGNGTVRAIPVYGGERLATTFYARAIYPSTCAELAASPPGATPAWTSAPGGVAIALPVIAGERIAVDVRIGHYAYGCADVDALGAHGTRDVQVTVYDLPMNLGLTNLDAQLGFTSSGATDSGWAAALAAGAAHLEGAFFPSGASDDQTLLDAMGALVPAAYQSDFEGQRLAGAWDALTATWLGSATAIRDRTAAWVQAAAAGGPGAVTAHIGPETSGNDAPVTIATIATFGAAAAGVIQPSPFTLDADADDTLHLSGAFDFASTSFVGRAADGRAGAQDPASKDVPSALASKGGIDCAGLATALVGSGVSYGTCDAACTASLCASALEATWKSASTPAADGSDRVHVTITASAPSQVGDAAEPQFVQGSWLGSAAYGPTPPFALSGTFLATESTSP